jgi:hypothetical protein
MHEKIMTPERIFRDKLRKIEALFAGSATPGEKAAAGRSCRTHPSAAWTNSNS